MKNDEAIQHSEHKLIKHQNILIQHCMASAHKQAVSLMKLVQKKNNMRESVIVRDE
jgi:hypothetical protein